MRHPVERLRGQGRHLQPRLVQRERDRADGRVNRWNLRDHSGFSLDLLRELKDAATANGIKLGFYYSTWDWHDPDFVANFPAYVTTMKAQLQELVTNYDPALLWFDGEWTETNPTNPWSEQNGEDLERFVRGISPQVVTNNRIGKRRPSTATTALPSRPSPAPRHRHSYRNPA